MAATYAIDSVSIQWEHSGAHLFYLQTLKAGATLPDSNDGGWTTFYTDSTSYDAARDRCYDSIKVQPAVNARYLRLRCVKRIFTYGYGVIEFRAFGASAVNEIRSVVAAGKVAGLTLRGNNTGVWIRPGSAGEVTTEIYSPGGHLVRRILGTGASFWNYKDSSGHSVAGGAYLIRAVSAGGVFQGKFVVCR